MQRLRSTTAGCFLPETLTAVANVHLDAVEHGEGIVFMHAVKEGPANQSYGLQVAALAGVPPSVIKRAQQRLVQLENQSASTVSSEPVEHYSLFASSSPEVHPAIEALEDIDPDNLTPREALDILYQLNKLTKNQPS